jgi:Cof subfamily protein (haloacid dehalogenase superfamily)
MDDEFVMAIARGLRPGGRFDEWDPRPVRGVFLDVDGTTLALDPRPTPAVVEACRAVTAAGLSLGFATGRPPAGLRVLHRETGSTGPDVVYNGAQVLQGGTELAAWPLPADAVTLLARWCRENGVYAEFAVGSGFVVSDFHEAARPSWDTVTGDPDGLVGDVDLAVAPTVKITVYAFDAAQLPALYAVCRGLDLHVDPSTAPLFPGVTIVNLTATGVTKASGIEWAAGRDGIELAELLVVGDSENDLSMLGAAGTAIAMGQSTPEIQAAAHLVTGSFEDDGAVTALLSCLDPV